jgi:uncharacterized membrane protein (DUF373 family)
MKNTAALVVFITTFITMYFVFSLVGSVFCSYNYQLVISSPDWAMMYSMFLGWWIAMIPAIETYQYLDK